MLDLVYNNKELKKNDNFIGVKLMVKCKEKMKQLIITFSDEQLKWLALYKIYEFKYGRMNSRVKQKNHQFKMKQNANESIVKIAR